jgi:GT2 family glycosyltransferase
MKVSSKYPKVSLVVLNWNGEKIIKGCLDSLLKTNYPNYKVIVVDNGSTDKSQEIIKRYFKNKVELILNNTNLGFPKGMNIGIKYAIKKHNPKYIGLLNNDLFFSDRNWLKKIIEIMEKDKTIGVASPMFIFPNGRIQRVGEKLGNSLASIMIKVLTALPEKKYKSEPRGIKEVDVFLGASPIIKREVIEKVGLLDERFSPFLVEDVEYSFRIKKIGYRSVTVCDSKVIHLLSYSIRRLTKEDIEKDLFKVYVATRNALLFSLEYFGIFKTLIISLPIIIFTSCFERKNKSKGLSLNNLGFRKALKRRVYFLVKSIRDAFNLLNGRIK